LQVRADLQIEELTMAKTAPATALLSSSTGGRASPPSAPPRRNTREPQVPPLGAPIGVASAAARGTGAAAPAATTPGRLWHRTSRRPTRRRWLPRLLCFDSTRRPTLRGWRRLAQLPESVDGLHPHVAWASRPASSTICWAGPAPSCLLRWAAWLVG
jgi:hypothetical protein